MIAFTRAGEHPAPTSSGELAHFKLDISGNGHAWKGEADALVCASESDLKL